MRLKCVLAGIFAVILGLGIIACSDSADEIDKMTSGEVGVNVQPIIVFKKDVIDSKNAYTPRSEKFKLNNKEITAHYVFTNNNELKIILPQSLESSTDYTLEVPLDSISKATKADIKSSKVAIKFKTEPNTLNIENMSFDSFDSDKNKANLIADIKLSSKSDIDSIKKATKIVDSKGKNIDFSVSIKRNEFEYSEKSSRYFIIKSSELNRSDNEDVSYTISFDSKILGLRNDVKDSIMLVNNNDLSVVNASGVSGEFPSININFSQDLAMEKNLKDFIKVSPEVKYSVAQSGSSIYLNGSFETNVNYEIKILKGLKASNGKAFLKEDSIQNVEIKDMPSKIIFSSQGVFLPQGANRKLSFKTMNIDKVGVKITRIYPNNLTQFFYNNDFSGDSNNQAYNMYYGINRIGDEVFKKEYDIKENKKNTWIQSEIDLSEMKNKSGIFIVEIGEPYPKANTESNVDSNDEDMESSPRYYYYDDDDYGYGSSDFKQSVAKHLVFSNIALIAQKGSDKLNITAINITNNTPAGGVKVSLINSKNQAIESRVTNASGEVDFALKKQEVLYILAEQGENKTMLKLRENNALSFEGFDVGGEVASNGFKAFIYTDRDVYRPGDSIHFNVIVRKENKPIDKAHPIFLSLKDSTRADILKEQSIAQNNGIYYYRIDTPKNANTGVWNATIDIGGNKFYKKISIESLAPDRIKVAIKAENKINLKDSNNLKVGVQGDYLFGSPASDLEYEAEIYFRASPFSSKKYVGYTFGSGSSNYDFRNRVEKSGSLDSKGYASFDLSLDSTKELDSNAKAIVFAKVYEKSNRFTKIGKEIELNKYDSFIGLGNNGSQIMTNKEISIPVIVLDSKDSKLISGKKLEYRIYNNEKSWWWDYDYYDSYSSIKSDSDSVLIASGEIVSGEKPVYLKHTFKQRGDVTIVVSDKDSGQTSKIKLYASEFGEPLSPKNITQLRIMSDKSQYNKGEVAKVSFESSAHSKALITINKDGKILKRMWKNAGAGVTNVDIPLDAAYTPNVYVNVALLQDYNNTNDMALRLYGSIPLSVKDSSTDIGYKIDAPSEIRPNADFEIKISSDSKKQSNFTLAIIDEGLLSLSGYKSPNAWKYFYAKNAMQLDTYDTYDLVINKTFGKVHNILKAGGDYADDDIDLSSVRNDDEKADRFKPVVLYTAPSVTDSNGNATLKFKMPSYIGNVRVMLVGVNDTALGQADSNIKVSAPAVMLPTLPRSLKIGDKFTLPIEVFATNESVKNASISIESKNNLVRFDKKNVSVDFSSSSKESKTIFFEGVVADSIGIDDISITLKANDFTMIDSTQIDVKAINPYTQSVDKFILNAGKSLNLEAPKSFVAKSNSGFIEISSFPYLAFNHRLSYLMGYPYGCIEQTTSAVMPQLFLDKLSNAKYIDKAKIAKNINAAIAKIQRHQVYNGGFAYWQGGRTADSWGSNYAGHFLLLAKNNGYSVSEAMLKQWLNYEVNYVKDNKSDIIRIYSLYLLALAKQPQIGIMNTIYEHDLKSLGNVEKWLLAATYKLANMGDMATKITKDLSINVESKSDYYGYTYGSNLRDKAIILLAYNTIFNKASESLFNDITKDIESKKWLSTQETGYALLALGNIKENAMDSMLKFDINVNNKKEAIAENARSLRFDFASGKASLESKSDKDLYVIQSWEGISIEPLKEEAKGLNIKREFLDNNGKALDISKLKSGDSFWIKLSVSATDSISNVALVQGMPSGWEIENLRFSGNIESSQDSYDDTERANPTSTLPSFVTPSSIAYTDIRDDKIMWFFNLDSAYNLDSNSGVGSVSGSKFAKVVFAKINVVTPGDFTLPPATAEAMYNNNYTATTNTQKVKVTSK
ncbi:hypothetical protein DCO58_10505 [Helicobacter saguini]|uniref:Alpha-2-macroglobulin family protein n=1 Tax=Helicobacter saguini TaxID=1548018 RepID=A0A4U8SZ41_9HELI|nr:MG2 domain-containing protein [Helicobacter saguini]MWV61270.1 hypothetical protein [Helicobacter saguini]MWV68063.1 hypothetical protein [Helicobacter saguini]MWV70474.1 hypothetical protein [Helicobacter saguini]TLD92339.1 alpha-2-macroglobulin family protein [Helicobacter saguini]